MSFEWDEDKAGANLEKHGVSFREAQTVFDDPLSMLTSMTLNILTESIAI